MLLQGFGKLSGLGVLHCNIYRESFRIVMFVCMLASGCVIEIYKLFASGSWTTCRAGARCCII